MRDQGFSLFEPPNVSGWPAYYQTPVYDLFWINSVTIKNRKQTTEGASRWGIWLGDGINIRLNVKDYLQTYEQPNNIEILLDQMEERLLGASLPSRAKSRILSSVLGDKSSSYWTELVDNYFSNPTKDNRNMLSWRFEQLLYQFHELAEIHLF